MLVNRAGANSPIRSSKLNEVLTLVSEAEWRFPDRPTIQLHLPYYFIADEMVYLTQLAAFAHYRPDPLPGTIFGGRFPISVWPRPLMWAFEWHEPAKDLVIKRGDPLSGLERGVRGLRLARLGDGDMPAANTAVRVAFGRIVPASTSSWCSRSRSAVQVSSRSRS